MYICTQLHVIMLIQCTYTYAAYYVYYCLSRSSCQQRLLVQQEPQICAGCRSVDPLLNIVGLDEHIVILCPPWLETSRNDIVRQRQKSSQNKATDKFSPNSGRLVVPSIFISSGISIFAFGIISTLLAYCYCYEGGEGIYCLLLDCYWSHI